ncbi:hypothetical protein [Streptacidiphilus sp. EB129]|uniref:hypothetical protein n=1 Tax=Streptacidiphilus sp. EB129 TaxID=3156262 RepID=UPI0035116FF0
MSNNRGWGQPGWGQPGWGQPGWGIPGGGPGYPGPPPWGVPRPPKPGVIPLHPLGFSEIVGGVFATVKRYPKALFVPLLQVALPALLLCAGYGGIAYGSLHSIYEQTRHSSTTTAQGLTITAFVLGGLLVLLLTLFAITVAGSTTSTVVLRYAVLGRPVTTREVWRESRPRLGRVAADMVLVIAVGVGIVIASMLPSLVVGVITHSLASLLLLLLMLPAFGLVLYVQVRLVLIVPVAVLEDQRPVAALRRAWSLNQGAWLRSFGIPYVIGLIGSFAGQIITLPAGIIGAFPLIQHGSQLGTPGAHPGIGDLLWLYTCLGISGAVVFVLTFPLTPLANGLLYIDRRIRRESLDVALLDAHAAYVQSSTAPAGTTTARAPVQDSTAQENPVQEDGVPTDTEPARTEPEIADSDGSDLET